MKFKNFLMSGMIAALAAFFVVGCNENPDDPGNGDGDEVAAVTNLGAVSLSSTSVGLAWDASTTTGATYKVAWAEGTTSVGSADVSTTTTTVEGLTEGKTYVFTVTAVDADDNESDPVSVTWSPASRYNVDAANTTMEINIYEKDATRGSGLALDVASPYEGPRNISVSGTHTDAELALAQLAMYINTNGTVKIGPASGFTVAEYANVAKFDQNTIVSDEATPVSSLNNWYMNGSLSGAMTQNRETPFTLDAVRTDGNGYGFVVRTGTSAANYHYARVFVKNNGGKILQGDSPNRFVSLVISYQNTAGVPYAKGN